MEEMQSLTNTGHVIRYIIANSGGFLSPLFISASHHCLPEWSIPTLTALSWIHCLENIYREKYRYENNLLFFFQPLRHFEKISRNCTWREPKMWKSFISKESRGDKGCEKEMLCLCRKISCWESVGQKTTIPLENLPVSIRVGHRFGIFTDNKTEQGLSADTGCKLIKNMQE